MFIDFINVDNEFAFDSSLYQTLEDLTIKFGIAMKSFKVLNFNVLSLLFILFNITQTNTSKLKSQFIKIV